MRFKEKGHVGLQPAPRTVDCPACAKAKIKRRISRLARERPKNAGDRWALDLFSLEPDGDGNNKILLLADRYSGFRFTAILDKTTTIVILKVIKHWINKLDILKIKVKVLELDNELADRPEIKDLLKGRGGTFEPSAPRTQAHNGGAERSRGVLLVMARAMRGHARFPHFLWAEVIKAAVYLLNRTPRQDLHWDTPIHAFYTSVAKQNRTTPPEKPDLSHLKAYRCKAYAMTPEAQEQTQ